MDERQTEAMFVELKEIREGGNETLRIVQLTDQKLNSHLVDHPPPVIIKQHLSQAEESARNVKTGIWGLVFKIVGAIIFGASTIVGAWIVAQG